MIRYNTLLISILSFCCFSLHAEKSMEQQISEYIDGKDARIGVAVIVDGADTIAVNGTKDFPMLSVYKFPQAIAVADYCTRNAIELSDTIDILPSELSENTWSPLRDKYGATRLRLPVNELLAYTLQQSDNNACDILFRLAGGPLAADSLIKSMGYPDINVASTEDEMHSDISLCYLNRSTPLEMSRLVDRFYRDLSHSSPECADIARLMESCSTGADRLAKSLAGRGVTIGHKTGTGDRNSQGRIIGVNDVGYIKIPGGRSYSISVFIADSAYDIAGTSAIIADISEIVFSCLTE